METAARWYRVSSGGQDEANQVPAVEQHCTSKGYADGPEYTVHARSAFHGRQQADLDRALADARAGLYQVLVIWHSDRLERREGKALLDVLAEFAAAGVRVESVQEPTLGQLDFGGQVLTFITGLVNHEKSAHLSQQVRLSHDTIRANGGVIGKAPYGFTITGQKYGKKLVHEPIEAGYIRAAVERYLSGESLAKVATWLNDEGQRSRQVSKDTGEYGPWIPEVLARLFHNPILMGRRMDQARTRTLARVDPIIDAATFDQLQARMAEAQRGQGIKGIRHDPALLTSIIRCTNGHNMYRIYAGSGKNRSAWYYCRKGCKIMIPVEKADAAMRHWLHSNTRQVPDTVTEVIPGSTHLAEIDECKRDLAEAAAAEDWDRLAGLRTEIERLRALPATPARTVEVPTGQSVWARWTGLDAAGQRQYLIDHGYRMTSTGRGVPWVGKD